MRKIITFLILLYGIALALNAQISSIAVDGTTWQYVHTTFSSFAIRNNVVNGDTLVNGRSYKKVYSYSQYDRNHAIYYCAFREEGNKIYALPSEHNCYLPVVNEEVLLYNFSLKEGDKFAMHEVTKVDSININGELRKRIAFSGYETWVEGIGSLQRYFGYPLESLPKDGTEINLESFEQNNELLYGSRRFNLLTDGVRWTERNSNGDVGEIGPFFDLEEFYVKGDTIINNVIYKNVYCNNHHYMSLRESGEGKIYYYTGDGDRLLYDFGWQVGSGRPFVYENRYGGQVEFQMNGNSYAVLEDGHTYEYVQVKYEPFTYYSHTKDIRVIMGIGLNTGIFTHLYRGDIDCICFKDLVSVYNSDNKLVYQNPLFKENGEAAMIKTVDEGKRWSVMASASGLPPGYLPKVWTEITVLQGDSIDNDKTYKKVYSTQNEDLSDLKLIGITRQEGDKIYYKDIRGKEEELFFDFGLKVGDAFTLWDEVCTVTAVRDTVINDISRKMLCLKAGSLEDKWIEGIGSLTNGLFTDRFIIAGARDLLLCCHQDNGLIYMNPEYNDCYIKRNSLIGDGVKWTELRYGGIERQHWDKTYYSIYGGKYMESDYYWRLYRNDVFIGYMREDENRNIYLWIDLQHSDKPAEEFLLYSFTKPWEVGDIIKHPYLDGAEVKYYESVVSEITNILLENGEIVPMANGIIFGIGNTNGIIEGISPQPTNGTSTCLLEYYRDNKLIYIDHDVVSIASLSAENDLRVVEKNGTIAFILTDAADDTLVYIYTANGQCIGQYPMQNGSITVKGLAAGMYLYQLTGKMPYKGKFIIE